MPSAPTQLWLNRISAINYGWAGKPILRKLEGAAQEAVEVRVHGYGAGWAKFNVYHHTVACTSAAEEDGPRKLFGVGLLQNMRAIQASSGWRQESPK